MKPDELQIAVDRAKKLAEQFPDYKSEIFTAILTKELLGVQNPIPSSNSGTASVSTKNLSVRELIKDKRPKNDVQTTLVLGYYLEVIKEKPGFTSQEISDCYGEAKEPTPKNVSDKIQMNIRNGWMMATNNKAGSSVLYTLTNTGLSIMEKGFKKDS